MYFLESLTWSKFLFGDQDMIFLLEVILRTIIMYIVILVGLRLTGKRGVRQLSIFELVVIIGLGSSAGDPMFYQEVGIISAIVVFMVVIGAYRLTTFLTGRSRKFEELIEGKTVCLIEKGKFCFQNFAKEDLAQDEFFSELRSKGVSQLGQVEFAYLEISGEVSVFYYTDEDVKYGLPLLPHEFCKQYKIIPVSDLYSCKFCGNTIKQEASQQPKCPICEKDTWIESSDRKRIN
ncbi:MAG: DUF421 domain-containing protein [Chitinophagaceae bacterium]|nr:DUF421 domain-containing protein [Chitinophagaceae bacterium]